MGHFRHLNRLKCTEADKPRGTGAFFCHVLAVQQSIAFWLQKAASNQAEKTETAALPAIFLPCASQLRYS
jgi:hypothetical protein